MTEEDRQKDFQRLLEIIALEEERGAIVPGGAVGGAAGRARAAHRKDALSVLLSVRESIRFVAYAVAAPQKAA